MPESCASFCLLVAKFQGWYSSSHLLISSYLSLMKFDSGVPAVKDAMVSAPTLRRAALAMSTELGMCVLLSGYRLIAETNGLCLVLVCGLEHHFVIDDDLVDFLAGIPP